MKATGITLVIIGALIGMATGVITVVTSTSDLKIGRDLAEIGLSLGSVAVAFSIMFITLVVLTAKNRAAKCGTLVMCACLAAAILGFVTSTFLVVLMPTYGNDDDYIGAIWLTSWFVSLFLSTVLIGGVLIRLGAAEPRERHAYR